MSGLKLGKNTETYCVVKGCFALKRSLFNSETAVKPSNLKKKNFSKL